MEIHDSMDQPKEQNTLKNITRPPTKFFVCLDYGFFAIFIGFLCFVLLKLVGI